MTGTHPLADASAEGGLYDTNNSFSQYLDSVYAQPYGEAPLQDDQQDATSALEAPTYASDSTTHLEKPVSITQQASQGTAGFGRALFLLIKGFIGTGILFLPSAFENGGLVFSIILLVLIALLSLWSFSLLVSARDSCGGNSSFGDIAEAAGGKWVRLLVQTSIVLGQLGFVCAYLIFIAENVQAFTLSVSQCKVDIPIGLLILVQIVIFGPLSLLRRIEKLGFASFLSTALIFFGLCYIIGNDIKVIVANGPAKPIKMFNGEKFALFIGTAVFAFSGIGLVIPIKESMREQQKFSRVMITAISVITLFMILVGGISYAAFGPQIKPNVVANLPQGSGMTYAIQLLYALAIALSVPLQLFPAITIMEKGLFGYFRSGRTSFKWKWTKNTFRIGVLAVAMLISWLGANALDKFISLVGSFACIPLCFIYPPLFHLRTGQRTKLQKYSDIGLILFGVAVMVYATWMTVMQWIGGSGAASKGFCQPVKA